MNSMLKSSALYAVNSLLITLGIGLPAQAHLNMNFHQHQNATSSNTTANPIQVRGNGDEPVVLPNVDRSGYWLFSDNATFVATDNDTNGQFSLFDFTTLPGGPLPHSHTLEDEFVYVLEGNITYQLGNETFTATPGTFVSKPKDVLHSFINAGDTPVRHLEFVIPSGIEGLFSTLGQPGTPDNPPPPLTPNDEMLEGGFQLLNDFGVVAPDSLMFAATEFGTKEGLPEVTIMRPGEATESLETTIALSNGTEIPISFEAGERIKTFAIPLDLIGDSESLELTITDTIALLQNKAVLNLGENNTYTLSDGYDPDDFSVLLPETQPESFLLAGGDYEFITTSEETEGLLSLFDVSIPDNSAAEQFLNAPTDLAFYTLDGDVTFDLGDRSFTAAPNTFVYLPEGNSYALSNSGDTSARTLLFNTTNPQGLETFIANNGTPTETSSVPEPTSIYGLLLFLTSSLIYIKKRQSRLNPS